MSISVRSSLLPVTIGGSLSVSAGPPGVPAAGAAPARGRYGA